MQSSHHQINFLEFSKFSEKLKIYVNTLALRTITSSFNIPPWTINNVKNYFYSYLTYLLPKCNLLIRKSVFWNFPNFQENSKYMSIHQLSGP